MNKIIEKEIMRAPEQYLRSTGNVKTRPGRIVVAHLTKLFHFLPFLNSGC